METLNLGEIAKEQVSNTRRKKKEETATANAKRRKSAMAKFLFRVFLFLVFTGGVYVFSCNYKLQTPLDVKVTPKALVVKRVTYTPIAYTDDILLSNDSKTDRQLGASVNGSKNPQIASIILGYFGFDEVGQDFIAIFTAESGLNPRAVNYNCEYREDGKMISRACNEADRERAWSVDCGIAQLNFAGTECPDTAFDPMWNIRMAKIKFDRQGRNAWVASWDDNYKKYLVRAD